MKKNKIIRIFIPIIVALSLVACASPAVTDAPSTDTADTVDSVDTTPIETTNTETTEPTVVEETTATGKDITIIVENPDKTIEVDGYYTGDVKSGKPEGKGKFAFWNNNDTYSMEYEGEFSNGTFNGKGKETEIENDRGIVRVYEGEFANGNYNGYGVLTITNTKENYSFDVVGTFTKGEFTPTTSEAFNYIGGLDFFGTFKLSNEQAEFVNGHKELFPTCEKAAAQAADLVNFTYKQFTKTRKQEEIGLIKLKLVAQQVFEDDILNGKLTSLLARDSDNNYYSVYYRDSVEVYDGDSFTVYAIPCSTSSFDNVGGGTTSVVVLLACCMQ